MVNIYWALTSVRYCASCFIDINSHHVEESWYNSKLYPNIYVRFPNKTGNFRKFILAQILHGENFRTYRNSFQSPVDIILTIILVLF